MLWHACFPALSLAAAKAVEATHQILKSIVTAAINEVSELQRYVNLKSEILAHSAVTLDKWVARTVGNAEPLVCPGTGPDCSISKQLPTNVPDQEPTTSPVLTLAG